MGLSAKDLAELTAKDDDDDEQRPWTDAYGYAGQVT